MNDLPEFSGICNSLSALKRSQSLTSSLQPPLDRSKFCAWWVSSHEISAAVFPLNPKPCRTIQGGKTLLFCYRMGRRKFPRIANQLEPCTSVTVLSLLMSFTRLPFFCANKLEPRTSVAVLSLLMAFARLPFFCGSGFIRVYFAITELWPRTYLAIKLYYCQD